MSGLDAYHARLIRRNRAKATATRGILYAAGYMLGWVLMLGLGGLALGVLAWVGRAVFRWLGGGL